MTPQKVLILKGQQFNFRSNLWTAQLGLAQVGAQKTAWVVHGWVVHGWRASRGFVCAHLERLCPSSRSWSGSRSWSRTLSAGTRSFGDQGGEEGRRLLMSSLCSAPVTGATRAREKLIGARTGEWMDRGSAQLTKRCPC